MLFSRVTHACAQQQAHLRHIQIPLQRGLHGCTDCIIAFGHGLVDRRRYYRGARAQDMHRRWQGFTRFYQAQHALTTASMLNCFLCCAFTALCVKHGQMPDTSASSLAHNPCLVVTCGPHAPQTDLQCIMFIVYLQWPLLGGGHLRLQHSLEAVSARRTPSRVA